MNVERLDRGQMFGLLAVLLGLLAPHAMRFPYWLTGVLLALFGWRLWLVLGQRKVPPGWVLLPIVWGLIYGILREFHTLLGRSGGVAVLSVLIAGKLLETRRRRDALLLIYLGYFLVVTNFLFDQTIALGAYLFAMVLAVTTLLVSWHSLVGMEGRWRVLWGQARLAAMLMLQAVPVMVLLFVFFPRIDGPLWKLPQDRAANRAGLADSMAPGSFSNLSQSDEVAFRATFHGPRPTQSQLYWRGPVFEDYDGTTWSQAPADGLPAPDLAPQGKAMPYTVTMEPHQRPWRLALDMPATLPDGAKLTSRLQVVGSPVDKRIRYDLAVATSYRAGLRERPDVLSRDLLLPANGNPRARAQAEKWRTLPPRERVYAGLRFLGLQGLQYTLQPPIYGRDPIDAFVYEGRQGFCEHFASAFVFMMRAAQVPARVIGGYQGGDENGDYLIVRQADAHAWGEVWLPGEGWVRVDPTFEVAPARIEKGLSSAVPDADLPYLLRLDDNWVRRIRLVMDAAVNNWNQWVIGYTPEKQREILRRLGIDDLLSSTFLAWFGGSLILLVGVLAAWLLWRMRPARRDAARREWDRFCRKLARKGLEPAPAEGPRDFARRAAMALPERAAAIEAVLTAYLAVRYGDAGRLAELARVVGAFRA